MSDPSTILPDHPTPDLAGYHYPQQYAQFISEVDEHEMTVLHEDGLYRHLRFAKPGTGIWHWDLITWPGSLAIRGDIGEGFVFSRTADMLAFFDHGQPDGWINASYWAEKLDRGGRSSVKEFSSDRFRQWLTEHDADPEIADDVETTDDAIDTLGLLDIDWDTGDPESWLDYEHHFLIALHAILWGAKRYHASQQHEAVPAGGAR